MKIFREKLFFDYKGYAEKYGEEAAERDKNYRSMAARKIADVRRDTRQDKGYASFFEGLSRNSVGDLAINDYTERSKKKLKAAEKLIQKAKEGTAKFEGYEMGKKATEESLNAARKAAKEKAVEVGSKAAIGAAAALTAAGIGYKLYKNKKKSNAKIDEEEGKKAGFNKKKVDAVVLDTKHKTDKKTGDYNGSK